MRNLPRVPPRPGFPASPCVDICTLDDRDVCIGCRRTIREIIDWSRMSAVEQWQVVRALPARKGQGEP
jgi:predicted Fe-S protein YdhL (DUF1289 family)